jgi:alpha-beta hydrolase superfamily lysophospholipase
MKKLLLSCLLTAVITIIVAVTAFVMGTGYFIGNYAVHFGLERGTADNPQEPPRAYALLMPPEARRFNKPDYTDETWHMTSADGLRQTATHFMPDTDSDRWVIVVHGYGCTQQNSWYIAENYLMMGYHVLTPDLRASGDSEGRFLTMGCRESEDIAAWARLVAQRHPQAKIVLHGVSMGAASVMMAAAREDLPTQAVACVEDCGYTSAFDLLVHQITESFGLPAFPAMQLLDWRCQKVAGFSLREAEPVAAVKKSKLPILFIHGSKDPLVPVSMAEELYEQAETPKKLLIIDGAVHAIASQKEQEKYFKTVNDFVKLYMETKE